MRCSQGREAYWSEVEAVSPILGAGTWCIKLHDAALVLHSMMPPSSLTAVAKLCGKQAMHGCLARPCSCEEEPREACMIGHMAYSSVLQHRERHRQAFKIVQGHQELATHKQEASTS